MTDFRALCAELLAALENEGYAHWSTAPDEDELCLRARAALAQPEPKEPTDEELQKLAGMFFTSTEFGFVDFARAVLVIPATMSELSPQAQAVWDAYGTLADLYNCEVTEAEMLAAALRTVAEQFYFDWNGMCCAEHLKEIARELDASEPVTEVQ